MSSLLVIGGASLDSLHFRGRTAASAGGAGMYTAMAARRCGVDASLFAPRPDPMPAVLQPVADRLRGWLGPTVAPAELPAFEISHEGGTTTYLKAFFGSESALTPDQLPGDLSGYDIVHVVPLGDPRRQIELIQGSRERGARLISAGTYIDSVHAAPALVRRILDLTDIFFLNGEEAAALFGSLESAATDAGKLLFITRGPQGARVIQGGYATDIPSRRADELDPTGAGDTFCGATLAGIISHEHPVIAARAGAALAAEMIEQVGPSALFYGAPPEISIDATVTVSEAQVEKIARLLARLDDASAFSFVGPELPPVGHPRALEYFFAATLQQFGFWSVREGRFEKPLVAQLGGSALKGSFYLFSAFLRRLERDADFCSPARQARLSRKELLEVFRADDGSDPMPALDLHLEQARAYGHDMHALKLNPPAILRAARSSAHPLRAFISQLDRIGGYKEDPLRKKSGLLALILSQRPERFLTFGEGEDVDPVIDYHLMRSCLRTGLIEVHDSELRAAIAERRVTGAQEEWAVRHASYRAIQRVVIESGKSLGAVDWFFFGARRRCPEMTAPECALCPVDPVCAHRTELFQPVYRTVFY
jgi:sugar/nucleoside kinase (ribokinase family)